MPNEVIDESGRQLFVVANSVTAFPPGLKSLAETAKETHLSEERLRAFADGGFVPHYRVDSGPPLFRPAEVRKWVAEHLIQRIEGKPLPFPIRIVEPLPIVKDRGRVPVPLQEIKDLCDITGEVRRTGIYFLCTNGEVLYIGQSVNAAARISNHTDKPFESAFFVPWPEDDLTRLESALIRAIRPPLNGVNKKGEPRVPAIASAGDIEVLSEIGFSAPTLRSGLE
jgi:hypothetical protein